MATQDVEAAAPPVRIDTEGDGPAPERPRRRRYLLWRIAGYVLFIGAWALVSSLTEPYILPSPLEVLREMGEVVRRDDFWINVSATLRHLAIGFTIAFVLGTTIGIAMGRSAYWDAFFRDYVMLTLTTPGLVFALICVMIFGLLGIGPIVAIVLTSFPHITVNVVEGVRAIPRDLMDMASAYGVDRRTRIRHIVLPAIAPFLFTAIRYGFAIAWKITALTELFGQTDGVGIQIRVEFLFFDIAGVLAWAFFLVGFALVMERFVLQRLERRFFRWRPKAFA
ncbi:MAG TPA: ABC transporter permease [Actinomycetota bacterium]|nr:ABC transporter permease [Actinomycetota bacterium]